MKFQDIDNIWTVDLTALSNADRGRVYFERAKQVVKSALADPVQRKAAVEGQRFRRAYLIEKIGSQPAVTTQNPAIRQLLEDVDRQIALENASSQRRSRPIPSLRSVESTELQANNDALRRQLELKNAEIADLKRQLREAGWMEHDDDAAGKLPW